MANHVSSPSVRMVLPLVSRTKRELLDCIEREASHYDLLEVWIDYLVDGHPDTLLAIARELPGRIIVVTRRPIMDECRVPLEGRKAWVRALAESPVLFDFDVVSQREEIEWAKQCMSAPRLITSFHDFGGTPPRDALVRITNLMAEFSPEVVKIATLCASPDDAIQLLKLGMDLRRHGFRAVVLGMGPFGAATRVFAPRWGGEWVYAPRRDGEHTAPGQLSREVLDQIYLLLDQSDAR